MIIRIEQLNYFQYKLNSSSELLAYNLLICYGDGYCHVIHFSHWKDIKGKMSDPDRSIQNSIQPYIMNFSTLIGVVFFSWKVQYHIENQFSKMRSTNSNYYSHHHNHLWHEIHIFLSIFKIIRRSLVPIEWVQFN